MNKESQGEKCLVVEETSVQKRQCILRFQIIFHTEHKQVAHMYSGPQASYL